MPSGLPHRSRWQVDWSYIGTERAPPAGRSKARRHHTIRVYMISDSATFRHFFTVDLEEYFQVLAFSPVISPSEWHRYPLRAESATDRLLELLDRHDARATFFTVGWLAERVPGLVRRIVEHGHEVASHSWWHRSLATLSPDEFREDARSEEHTSELQSH